MGSRPSLLLTSSVSPVAAQTAYTWTGGGSNTDWLTAANWTPTGGPPGVPGSTGNLDRALFDTAGTSVANAEHAQ